MHPRYRICLVLREYQGLSYQEIAAATGCSAEAVKTALFRAREDFRRQYHQLYPGRRGPQPWAALPASA
jgi:DNA-directed RNA polymerase specialized sigma24 family protein